MPDIEPSEENDYQAGSTIAFNRARWNAVMLSIATRLKARELLEASFEAMIADGTQAVLDMISENVAPQLNDLIEQINALEAQLEDIIGGGTAPNALQLGGQNPSYYLALANATGTLPVAQVTGVDVLIAAAVAGLVNAAPSTLDTLKELSDALGGDASKIEGYGKGAIVGGGGELEHGALWHNPGGYAMRELLGGAKAIVPSTKKVGGPGARIDIPVTHLNASYVRSHFDAIEVGINDAPRANELLLVLAMTTGPRVHARAGGLEAKDIKGEDGLR